MADYYPLITRAVAGLDKSTGDRCRADHPQERRRKIRFHVDLQGATGVASHDQFNDAVRSAAFGRNVLRQAKQPRLAVC